jgi:hypothetical protein
MATNGTNSFAVSKSKNETGRNAIAIGSGVSTSKDYELVIGLAVQNDELPCEVRDAIEYIESREGKPFEEDDWPGIECANRLVKFINGLKGEVKAAKVNELRVVMTPEEYAVVHRVLMRAASNGN